MKSEGEYMFREINIADTPEVAEICNAVLDYDVDVENVKKQIEKLTNDKNQHIIIYSILF